MMSWTFYYVSLFSSSPEWVYLCVWGELYVKAEISHMMCSVRVECDFYLQPSLTGLSFGDNRNHMGSSETHKADLVECLSGYSFYWKPSVDCSASRLVSMVNVHWHTSVWWLRSAHLISRYRPRAPIIAVTRNGQTARQAHLYRGIFPVFYNKQSNDVWAEDVDLRVNFAMDVGKRKNEALRDVLHHLTLNSKTFKFCQPCAHLFLR